MTPQTRYSFYVLLAGLTAALSLILSEVAIRPYTIPPLLVIILGNLIGGGKKNDRYDCEAALDSYLSQYGTQGVAPARIASRSIPAPAPAYSYGQGYPAYAPGYAYAPAYSYSYAPPPQMVMVPMRYEQPQRVIVRETVREERVPATRSIPTPAPAPQPVPVSRPAPSPKMIKGN